MSQVENADKLQQVISDNLFPEVQHVSDVKQVLESMEKKAQDLRPEQIRAILFLREMGNNEYLHGEGNPYEKLIEFIMDGKKLVANPGYYIETIEALIPKPPKPIVMAEKQGGKK
ncbi:hypothetical protein [Tenuibacillus multivorans]|uniref:Uncharacterized protein n=1 Tax=Tenuibacillus multivorans TaxID=237069 RepID=A0A1H0DFT2_9BACI|nr:hypothetical protein [Tenuibacillus multivorans]GEL76571.1 hypothetical protein TMU01_08060 [Tenuibacillus multivorans]SDN68993.1 hypothetical protein SAMN05216498_2854 [Tenuibacillus multivorans]